MKHSFYLILFLSGFFLSSSAQEGQSDIFIQKGDLNCHYKRKYTEEQRREFYPFNSAQTVKLVSFRYHKNNSPIHIDSLVTDSLIEVKVLSSPQVNRLTDIVYNNFYKEEPNYDIASMCFFPRNAILFIDREGKLLEYVIICFQCTNFATSSENIQFGDDCDQKINKLRKFFIDSGVKFGTNMKIDKYLGETLTDEGIELTR